MWSQCLTKGCSSFCLMRFCAASICCLFPISQTCHGPKGWRYTYKYKAGHTVLPAHTSHMSVHWLIDWYQSIIHIYAVLCSCITLPLMMNTRSLSDWGGPRSSSMWAPLWACSWWIVAPPTYIKGSKHFGWCTAENNNNPRPSEPPTAVQL